MSSRKINITTSSSEDDENRYANIADEKKRKRMISNRESARRSRMKKEQHVKDLNDQLSYLRTKTNEVVRKIEEIGPRYAAVESENRILRMQSDELQKRLESLQGLLVSCRVITRSGYGGVSCDDIVRNNNINNNDKNKNDDDDDDDEFYVMENILQEPWLQHSFDQYSQTVDGI